MAAQKLTDEMIDQLLDASDATHGDNSLVVFARMQERKRKRNHAAAKLAQPVIEANVKFSEGLIAFIRSPITETDGERGMGALEHLLLTVQDTIDAWKPGDPIDDMVLAAFRVFRKCWAWNLPQLGPIERAANAQK